jgi:hypothetical protein
LDVATILVLFPTVLAWMVVLGAWAEPVRTKTDRQSVVLVGLHIASALVAVTLWLVFAVGRSRFIGWLGMALLATTILLGASTLIRSRRTEQATPLGESPRPVPPAALLVHGGFAILAAALAVAAMVAR